MADEDTDAKSAEKILTDDKKKESEDVDKIIKELVEAKLDPKRRSMRARRSRSAPYR